MKGGRRLSGLVVPVGLLALLLVLAALQYRWTGQMSEAESERMRAGLAGSVRRFAQEFDDEIGRIVRSVLWSSGRAELVGAVREFRAEAPYPGIVRGFYLVSVDASGALVAERLDAVGPPGVDGTGGEWRLLESAIGERLELGERRRARRPPLPFVWHDPAAVVIPVIERGEILPVTRRRDGYVVARLDREELSRQFFPDLVDKHFRAGEETLFDVAVVDESRRAVFVTGGDGGAARTEEIASNADASSPLFSLRRALGGSRVAPEDGARAPGPPRGRAPGLRPRGRRPGLREAGRDLARGHWRVFARHREGSLEAAVRNARLRNLGLSFTVLGLLGASVVLVSLSARRAAELGERQMEFVAGVSHELRTPLAVIRSASQNLADGSVSEPAQVRRYGSLIESHGKRLHDLVDQVLALAGISSGSRSLGLERISAKSLASGALEDSEREIEESGASVSATIPEGLDVMGDEESLRRALANLLVNAAKHGGPSASIRLSAERRDGRWIVLAVSDSGEGVPADESAHLLEAFYRGRRARERQTPGSGLGLSLVDRIARDHGGRVEWSSAPGAGATFRIVLPAAGDGR